MWLAGAESNTLKGSKTGDSDISAFPAASRATARGEGSRTSNEAAFFFQRVSLMECLEQLGGAMRKDLGTMIRDLKLGAACFCRIRCEVQIMPAKVASARGAELPELAGARFGLRY